MAQIVWTEPALSDLDAIADYIALDNPLAAQKLVRRIFGHADQLGAYPESGSKPPELKGWSYRQLVEPPCRVFYRYERNTVYILHVIRTEQRLRRTKLTKRDTEKKENPHDET